MTRIHKKRKNFEFKLSIRLITKKKQSTTNGNFLFIKKFEQRTTS